MKRRSVSILGLIGLCLATLLLTVQTGLAQVPAGRTRFEIPNRTIPAPAPMLQPRVEALSPISTACALQPEPRPQPARSLQIPRDALVLARFRQTDPNADTGFMPREEIALADTTNFGDRFLRDINGNPADLEPIVVLHETVGSANSAINLFRTPHLRDDDQASYHTLIRRDGTIVYLVPPEKRAYGAGNSIFMGSNGLETVQTKLNYPPSVNNFAYHISLESPYDGNHNGYQHSGYSEAQYQSLAWLVARTGIDQTRLTTHKSVDRSRSRIDPRTFDTGRFLRLLSAYPKTTEISIRCTPPA